MDAADLNQQSREGIFTVVLRTRWALRLTHRMSISRSHPLCCSHNDYIGASDFRMPPDLRARLRRFAKERNLAEAEALRLVVSEHLAEVENERELAAAERWQFKQAYATWQRSMRGE